jgi:hypothetical protein
VSRPPLNIILPRLLIHHLSSAHRANRHFIPCNKTATKADFGGCFFDLTTAELLVAQSLGNRYRFAFVNTLSRDWIDMTLKETFSRARKIYPKWAISF